MVRKNKKRRYLAVIMAFVLAVQMLPLPAGAMPGLFDTASISRAAAAGPTSGSAGLNGGNNITWSLVDITQPGGREAYKLVLSGNGQMQAFSQEAYKVGNNTYYRTNAPWKLDVDLIQEIVVDSGITTIGSYAFYKCGNAVSVQIPGTVTDIGASALEGCSSLRAINLPNGVKSIGSNAFASCSSAESLDMPNSVTVIGSYAFFMCSKVKAIKISTGVTAVNNYAFYGCGSATSLEIPSGVTSIGYSAFDSCSALTKINIPAGVKSIGQSAFSGCTDAVSLDIPSTVTSMGSSAFERCSKLKEVSIPGSVGTIPGSAFLLCRELEKVTVGEGITSIGSRAFESCYALKESGLIFPKSSLTALGQDCFTDSGIVNFEVPASVTSIPVNPYVGGQLKNITVASGNKNYAVQNNMLLELSHAKANRVVCYPCNGGKDAIVPSNVEVIGQNAFKKTKIETVDLPGSLVKIDENAFINAARLKKIDIPGKVTVIKNSAFKECKALKDVSLGGDILTIGTYAFSYCSEIVELSLPDKITEIEAGAFQHCTKLKELTFPNSITKIGSNVLANCSVLEKVSFGEKIQTISGNVFNACPKLADITISPNNTYMTVENNVVYNKNKTKLIYYAAGLPDEKFMMAETVETVGGYAFTYCTKLSELRFPKSVVSMEEYAVYHNDALGKLLFYGNAPIVKEQATYQKYQNGIQYYNVFNGSVRENKVTGGYDNTGMVVFKTENSTGWEMGWEGSAQYTTGGTNHYTWVQKYTILKWDPAKADKAEGDFQNGLRWKYRDDIGELTFYGSGEVPDAAPGNLYTWSNDPQINHMQDIQLIETEPASGIGNYAFYGAKNLVRILSGNSLARIGENAFEKCGNLKIVQVPSVSKIEKEAFRDDTSIVDELDVRGAVDIGEGAFKGCTGMTDILLGEKLNRLGKEVFQGCVALETLMLPESLTSLGEGSFKDCQALRTINIPKNVAAMPGNCFAGCSGFQKIYFYGNPPSPWDKTSFDGTHSDLTIYYRKSNGTWDSVGNQWNGIPVVGLDKFYTEKKDHYSFANTGSSFGYTGRYYIPRQRYVTAMQSIIRGSYYYSWDKGWKGSCFGMASSSTEFYQGNQFDVKNYSASAKTLYDVAAPKSAGADLTKLIEIYQVSQFVDEIGIDVSGNYGEYRKLIKQVEEFERSGGLGIDSTADPVIMCIYTKCTGHAVVPVAVNMDLDGNYILDVYDCNYPSKLQKLTIKKDFSEIVYGQYKTASFVKYSTIRDALADADFTGNDMKKSAAESSKVSIAVNKENVKLVNGGGKDYKEIKGAYEQKIISDGAEDTFGGIRSFVLPQGEYNIRDDGSTQQDKLQYYIATEDLFSEVETSDKDAQLTVKSVKGTGLDTLTLSSDKADTQSELTVMDVSGIKKEIAVKGSKISVEVENDDTMKLSVENAASVKINGEDAKLQDGRASVSFFAQKGENPMLADDLNCSLSLDKTGNISGMAEAYVTWAAKTAQDVKLVTKVKDESGSIIAAYEDKVNLKAGMQKVNVTLDKKKADLGKLSGEIKAVCEMTLEDADKNKAVVSCRDIVLKTAGAEIQPTKAPVPSSVPAPVDTNSPAPTQAPAVTEKPPVQTEEPPEITEPPVQTEEPPKVTEPPVQPPASAPPSDVEEPNPPVQDDENPSVLGKVKTVGSLKYVVRSDAQKTAAVCGAKKKSAKSVKIPKKVKINGRSYKVTSIDKNAFSNMRKLTNVTIGGNVKKIGDGAFKNCRKLEFIVIPGKVTAIGKKSFAGCRKLRYMVLKTNKIKSVDSGAFQGVSPKMKVKTTKQKWAKYQKMFIKKGRMPKKALFLIDPVKIKYKGKIY